MTARSQLPDRRGSITFDVVAFNLVFTVTASAFADGGTAELFVRNHKATIPPPASWPRTAPSPLRWRCNTVAPPMFCAKR